MPESGLTVIGGGLAGCEAANALPGPPPPPPARPPPPPTPPPPLPPPGTSDNENSDARGTPHSPP